MRRESKVFLSETQKSLLKAEFNSHFLSPLLIVGFSNIVGISYFLFDIIFFDSFLLFEIGIINNELV